MLTESGSSGSGKTTLLNLIMQTWDDYKGNILFDGVELRSILPDSLFQILSLVQQNVFVFNDTLYHNVTLYKDFPESDIQAAVSEAGLLELLDSHGKEYLCGENGSGLSGGEKQRISIARALLRKTSVLAMEDITEIIVTHRLEESVMRKYDEIIVLHHGEVTESGAFEELMEKRGMFYSLFTVSQV